MFYMQFVSFSEITHMYYPDDRYMLRISILS